MKKIGLCISLALAALCITGCDCPECGVATGLSVNTDVVVVSGATAATQTSVPGQISLKSSYSWTATNSAPTYINFPTTGSGGTTSFPIHLTDAFFTAFTANPSQFPIEMGVYKVGDIRFVSSNGDIKNVKVYYAHLTLLMICACPEFAQGLADELGITVNTPLTLTHYAALTKVDVSGNALVTSLVGIEYFPNLKRVDVSETGIAKIDLSKNNIESFIANSCMNIGRIELGNNNTSLTNLNLNQSVIPSTVDLDLSGCPNLDHLRLAGYLGAPIDVSQNPNLTLLVVGGTFESNYVTGVLGGARNMGLTSLNLSNNPLIDSLVIQNAEIASVDVSHLSGLKMFAVRTLLLTSVDVSNNAELLSLEVAGMPMTLDVSQNPELSKMTYIYTDLQASEAAVALNLSNNPEIAEIVTTHSGVSCITLPANPTALWRLQMPFCVNMTAFDFSNCTALDWMNISHSGYTGTVDISNCTNVTFVQVNNMINSITLKVWAGFNTARMPGGTVEYIAGGGGTVTIDDTP